MPLIGFDCNGKPLYAGDRCVLLYVGAEAKRKTGCHAGIVVRAVGTETIGGVEMIKLDLPEVEEKGYRPLIQSKHLRKLPKDQHRPADRSFADMMRGIKTLMPEVKQL